MKKIFYKSILNNCLYTMNRFNVLHLFDRKNFKFSNSNIFEFKNGEISKQDFNISLEKWLNETALNKPGLKLNPNILNYIEENLKYKIRFSKKDFVPYIVNNNANTRKLEKDNSKENEENKKKSFRKQDYFTFKLVNTLRKELETKMENSKKNSLYNNIYQDIYENLFENSSYLNKLFLGDIEYPRYINNKSYRTDLEFTFNLNSTENDNTFKIIIEYLEPHHDPIDEYDRDEFRLYKIKRSNQEIKATWIVLEKNIKNFNETTKQIAEKLLNLLVDLYLLENEREFIIGHLLLITDNIHFSTSLYDSWNVKNTDNEKCIIEKNQLSGFINFKNDGNSQIQYDEYYKESINKLIRYENNKQIINEESDYDSDLDDLDSDDGDDDNDELENVISNKEIISQNDFYQTNSKNEITTFSFKGYQYYLLMLKEEYLKNEIDRLKIYGIYINITDEFMNSLQERYNKLNNFHSDKSNNSSFIII